MNRFENLLPVLYYPLEVIVAPKTFIASYVVGAIAGFCLAVLTNELLTRLDGNSQGERVRYYKYVKNTDSYYKEHFSSSRYNFFKECVLIPNLTHRLVAPFLPILSKTLAVTSRYSFRLIAVAKLIHRLIFPIVSSLGKLSALISGFECGILTVGAFTGWYINLYSRLKRVHKKMLDKSHYLRTKPNIALWT